MTLQADRCPVTLSYPGMGSDHRLWGTRASPYLIFRAFRAFCEPHRNPTSHLIWGDGRGGVKMATVRVAAGGGRCRCVAGGRAAVRARG